MARSSQGASLHKHVASQDASLSGLWMLTIKAAQFNILILTMDHINMCNVKGVTSNGIPAENYHISAVLASFGLFSLLFWL